MHVIIALLAAFGAQPSSYVVVASPAWQGEATRSAYVCTPIGGAEYYSFELFTTKNIPGTGLARGLAEVSLPRTSPFSIALAPDGSYAYDVHVSLSRMKEPSQGHLVAWITTTDLSGVVRMGTLDDKLQAGASVAWNKFLVIVTLEADDDPTASRWTGPVVFRGMSRSGMMHTMVGHGPLQQENCAAYGYGN